MAAVINDPDLERQLIARRRATGADRYDEVWEGIYVMAPMANDEHQSLVNDICTVLTVVIGWTGLGQVRPGVNVSDRPVDWQANYRCPDVVVFLNETTARNCGAFWHGGPDFAVEIVSPGDQTFERLSFYAKVRTREVLIVDRDPWALMLYRLQSDRLVEVGRSTREDPRELTSKVLPLTWKLLVDDRPRIEIRRADGSQQWTMDGVRS